MGHKNDQVITSFVKIIEKNISPCQIILFGSRATGKAKASSDYDFLLVSPKFKKWEWEERSARVYRLKRGIPAAMDFLCFTPSEFKKKKKQISLVRQAVKEGILVS